MRNSGPIGAVLFDWDGTLLDSYQANVHAYRRMFRALGVGWDEGKLRRYYSPDWYRVYRAARLEPSRWAEADRLWRRYYRQSRPGLMPGARRVLRRLDRRFALALVTSGNRARVNRELNHFGLAGVFPVRVFSEDVARRKPHPAALRLALRRLRIGPEACVYVGDAPEDIEMARRAGVRAVALLGPFPTHRGLRAARPDAVLGSIGELPDLLDTRR